MSGEHSLKETKELIFAVKMLTIDALKAAEDGISFDDLNVVFKNIGNIKTAIEDIKAIGDEMKDLQPEEIKELVSEGVDLVFEIVAAVKSYVEAQKKA